MVVDNESVVNSVSAPESRLKKKHLSICYHSVREAVAGGIVAVRLAKSECNLADICTKTTQLDPCPKETEAITQRLNL